MEVTVLGKLFWAAQNVEVLLEGGNCGGIGNFVVFPILSQCCVKDFGPVSLM